MRIQNLNQNAQIKNKQKINNKNQTGFSLQASSNNAQKSAQIQHNNPIPDANILTIIQEESQHNEQNQIIKQTVKKAENILNVLDEIKIQMLQQKNKQKTTSKLTELEKIIEETMNYGFIDTQLKNIIGDINIRLKVEIAKQKFHTK